jgi:hypothetical protein
VGARETQGLPERSGGLGGFAESCRPGSRGTIATEKRGKLDQASLSLLLLLVVVVGGWSSSSRLEWNAGECRRGLSSEGNQTKQARPERREGDRLIEIGCAIRAKPRPRKREVLSSFPFSKGVVFCPLEWNDCGRGISVLHVDDLEKVTENADTFARYDGELRLRIQDAEGDEREIRIGVESLESKSKHS